MALLIPKNLGGVGSGEKKDVIPPDLYLYKDGEMLNGGVTFNTVKYGSLSYGQVTQESTRVFLYVNPYPSAASISIPQFQYDDYSAVCFDVQEPTLNNNQKFTWRFDISSWTGRGAFTLFKGGSDGTYWVATANNGSYSSGVTKYNGTSGTGQYMYISRVWLVPKYEKYLYKDGNVQEQTVPLYTDGLQNVAWDNSGYKYKSNWTSAGGATIDATSFVVDVPSGTTQTKSIVTDAPIDFAPYSKVVIEYDNGKTFEFNVGNVSESGYLTIGAYRNSSSDYGTLIRVSSTKDNFASTYLAEGTITYQATSMRVSKVKLVKSVAKATNKDAVDWDNRGYNGNSSFQSEGGLNITDNGIVMSAPSANYSKSIVNNIPVDVSNYSTLKILYNNTSVVSADISAIKGAIYLTLTSLRNSSNYYNIVYCSNAKTGYNGGTGYISQQYIVPTATSAQTITINRIWLEK